MKEEEGVSWIRMEEEKEVSGSEADLMTRDKVSLMKWRSEIGKRVDCVCEHHGVGRQSHEQEKCYR